MGDIHTPIDTSWNDGDTHVELRWAPNFGSVWSGKFDLAQAWVDNEVLRLCDPLVPFQTGTLKNSGKLGTQIGSGEVRYIAPYAHHQYYDTAETRSYDANRGAKWFERMKAAHFDEIQRGVKKYINQ